MDDIHRHFSQTSEIKIFDVGYRSGLILNSLVKADADLTYAPTFDWPNLAAAIARPATDLSHDDESQEFGRQG